MMGITIFELKNIISELKLTQQEVANLLRVNIRTIGRWIENPSKITGPAKQTLLAWQKLNRYGWPWRPDGIDILNESQQEKVINKIKQWGLKNARHKSGKGDCT